MRQGEVGSRLDCAYFPFFSFFDWAHFFDVLFGRIVLFGRPRPLLKRGLVFFAPSVTLLQPPLRFLAMHDYFWAVGHLRRLHRHPFQAHLGLSKFLIGWQRFLLSLLSAYEGNFQKIPLVNITDVFPGRACVRL